MKIKIKKKEVLTVFIYIVVMIIYMICVSVWGLSSGNKNDDLRYYAFAFAVLVAYWTMFRQGKLIRERKTLYGREIQYVYLVVIIFYILSLIQARNMEHTLDRRTYIQLALLLIPAMYSFCMVNLLSFQTIVKLFEITLYMTIVFYFYEKISQMGIDLFLDSDNWLKISFSNSYSPFENNSYAEIFFVLFLFFNYYRKVQWNYNEKILLKFCYILSIVFVFLSFKRLAIVFLIFILIFNRIVDLRGELPLRLPLITAFLFTVATIMYTKFMQGTLLSGFNVSKFSTGRDYILSLWKAKNYVSYGYGSSMNLIGRYLEMDLVQIYLEIGWIAVFIFSYCYFTIARKSIYAYVIMAYEFLNLLTASSIPYPPSWILVFITLASISSKKSEIEGINISGRGLGILFRKNMGEKKNEFIN